jgi:Spy/CpxP family protein refolding chaperone
MAELQKQLHLALLADTVDTAKLEQLKQSIAAAEATALAHRIDVQTRIAQVLTPEQRATARQNVEKMERPFGRPGRGGGGPGRR